jgi:hypothetical protein
MATKSRAAVIVWGILLRIILLCVVIALAAYSAHFFLDILENYLGYKTPSGFFGFTFADAFVALDLGLLFWGSLIFGILGKKIDYLIVFLLLLSALWEYFGTETITTNMYIGLVIALLVGSVIGFVLKLARQKFLPKLKV